ncbi:MAG: HIT domain-containing protein [Gammaproteobacteria bacterium]|nr:HIT domain-containing protein [Gammaproteobacteria bacterium]
MAFALDSRLQRDTFLLGSNDQELLLLMNDRRYPWFIIVPTQDGASEWFDLPEPDQATLHRHCVQLGAAVHTQFHCEKVNIAALGNIVRQMHVHIIGRHTDDPAWPGPVWGHSAAIPYDKPALEQMKAQLLKMKELPFTLQ